MVLKVQFNKDLRAYNSFGIACKADALLEFSDLNSWGELFQSRLFQEKKKFILGGGSNVLFSGDFSGLIIHPILKGIEKISESDDFVWLRAMSGENWDDVVAYAVENGFGGIENLSLIPGKLGSAVVQNIGAYGRELQDVFYAAHGFDLESGEEVSFSKEQCQFAYRQSIFKQGLHNRILITSVDLQLEKHPKLYLEYESLAEKLNLENHLALNCQRVRQLICDIRNSKLPDPKTIGNAGSFFKNPTVTEAEFLELQKAHPGIKSYPSLENHRKIAAAWLIEQCGWKGYRKDDVGVHPLQALVLVNYGKATGQEILKLATEIMKDVYQRFGIHLEKEVIVL